MRETVFFDPLCVEIQSLNCNALVRTEKTQSKHDADDEAKLSNLSNSSCNMKFSQFTGFPILNESNSGASSLSLNSYLPPPWYDSEDLCMQPVDTPSMVETSKSTKITMMKACKALGMNVLGFKHEISGHNYVNEREEEKPISRT